MNITVLFFGATAAAVGARKFQIDLPADASALSAYEHIIAAHPSLANHELRYSVNQKYAVGDERLKDGDEVAIFTAVSGG